MATVKRTQEFLDYVKDVIWRNPIVRAGDPDAKAWVRNQSFEWVLELADYMLAEGFMIDKVIYAITSSNEDRRPEQPSVTWEGFCYDADCADYAFKAIWHVNPEKFSPLSLPKYYDLTDLEIEPKADYDMRQAAWARSWRKTHKPRR